MKVKVISQRSYAPGSDRDRATQCGLAHHDKPFDELVAALDVLKLDASSGRAWANWLVKQGVIKVASDSTTGRN